MKRYTHQHEQYVVKFQVESPTQTDDNWFERANERRRRAKSSSRTGRLLFALCCTNEANNFIRFFFVFFWFFVLSIGARRSTFNLFYASFLVFCTVAVFFSTLTLAFPVCSCLLLFFFLFILCSFWRRLFSKRILSLFFLIAFFLRWFLCSTNLWMAINDALSIF